MQMQMQMQKHKQKQKQVQINILQLWRHIKYMTPSMDAYLVEEQSCKI